MMVADGVAPNTFMHLTNLVFPMSLQLPEQSRPFMGPNLYICPGKKICFSIFGVGVSASHLLDDCFRWRIYSNASGWSRDRGLWAFMPKWIQ